MTSQDDRNPQVEQQLLDFFSTETLGETAPTTAHLDDGVLARIAEGSLRPDAQQRAHLADCRECRDVLGIAAAMAPSEVEVRRASRWKWTLFPGFAMAAVAAVAVFMVGDPTSETYRTRGGVDRYTEASVTFLRSDARGRAVVEAGATVALDAQLGFRYGNPTGEARTLTVLGFDGETIHWYYPERAGGAPMALDRGPDAVSRRLPFDIRLQERHRAGALHLYAAFDVDPDELAAAIVRGAPPPGATHLKIELVEP